MGTQRVGHDWVTQHSLAQTWIKAVIPYELHNFKMPNRRKEKKISKRKKYPKALAENELSTKGKTKQ